MGRFWGCPDSMRVISGSGPFGPPLKGVWQSLQPPIVTRYLPRSALSAVVRPSASLRVVHDAAARLRAATITIILTLFRSLMFVLLSLVSEGNFTGALKSGFLNDGSGNRKCWLNKR